MIDIDFTPEKLKMDSGEEPPQPEVTRGVRNNNPFNLEYREKEDWEGKLPHDPTIESRFERFISPEAGIRAGAINVLTHYSRGDNTIFKLLHTLSPPSDNPTKDYIGHITREMNIAQHEILDLTDPMILRGLATAIIEYENDNYAYGDELLEGAVGRALEHRSNLTTKNTGGPVTQPLYDDRKYII